MSEYAPSTGNVRVAYVTGAGGDHGIDRDEASAEFDRWLAAHDAQVRADVAEAIEAIRCGYRSEDGCDYCQGLERAASVARDHGGER